MTQDRNALDYNGSYIWEVELAAALGYHTAQLQLAGKPLPLSLTEYKLPMHPFVIEGDTVHITELDLDEKGNRLTERTITRPLPEGFVVPEGVSR